MRKRIFMMSFSWHFFYAFLLELLNLQTATRITKLDVEKIANLARLRLSEEEKEKHRNHLENILAYVEKLNELNTESVEPMCFGQRACEVMREDRTDNSLNRDEVLRNAPAHDDDFFRSPKVIT